MLEYIKKAWTGLAQQDRTAIFEFHKATFDGMGSVGVDILTGATLLEARKALSNDEADITLVRLKVSGFLNSLLSTEKKLIDANQLKVDWSFWA